jgi:hypothetical protein
MTLATYSDLQTQVANWLARTDLNVYIPDMIALFEAAACRRLKVRPMELVATATTTSGAVALPSDFLGMRRVTWVGPTVNVDLEYVHPSEFQFFTPNPANTGTPQVFTIEGGNLKVSPIDDSGVLEMVYSQRIPTVASSLNWLWTAHPDAYLFGTLAEAAFFNKGSALPMAGIWKQRRDEVFDEIKNLEFRDRALMSVRVMGVTP